MKICAFSYIYIFSLPSPSAFPLAFLSPFLLSLLITLSPFFYLHLPCCPLLSLTFLPFPYSTFLFSPSSLYISPFLPLSIYLFLFSSHYLSSSTSLHPFYFTFCSFSLPPFTLLFFTFLPSLSLLQYSLLSALSSFICPPSPTPPFLSLPVFSFSLSNSISFFLIPILLL